MTDELTPLDAPPAPLAFSADELRALSRVLGFALPTFVLEGEPGAGDELAPDLDDLDAVALRSLAARGLVTLGDDPADEDVIRVTDAGRDALGALVEPRSLVEVEADRVDSPWVQRHVVVEGRGGTVVLEEMAADVWRCWAGTDRRRAVLAVVALSSGGSDGNGDGGEAVVRVPPAVHRDADDALEAEGPEAAVAVLVAGGADAGAAAAWVDAVEHREASMEVRCALLHEGGIVSAGSLRVVDAGAGAAWLLELEGDEADDDAATSVVRRVPTSEAARLLEDLVAD